MTIEIVKEKCTITIDDWNLEDFERSSDFKKHGESYHELTHNELYNLLKTGPCKLYIKPNLHNLLREVVAINVENHKTNRIGFLNEIYQIEWCDRAYIKIDNIYRPLTPLEFKKVYKKIYFQDYEVLENSQSDLEIALELKIMYEDWANKSENEKEEFLTRLFNSNLRITFGGLPCGTCIGSTDSTRYGQIKAHIKNTSSQKCFTIQETLMKLYQFLSNNDNICEKIKYNYMLPEVELGFNHINRKNCINTLSEFYHFTKLIKSRSLMRRSEAHDLETAFHMNIEYYKHRNTTQRVYVNINSNERIEVDTLLGGCSILLRYAEQPLYEFFKPVLDELKHK